MSDATFQERTEPVLPFAGVDPAVYQQATGQNPPAENVLYTRLPDGSFVPATLPAPAPASAPATQPEPVTDPGFTVWVHLADGRVERAAERPEGPHWIDPDGTSTMIIGVYPR